MAGLGSSLVGLRLPQSMASLGASATQGGGAQPAPGYVFLQGKNADGSYSTLTGLNADTSRSNLQGKAA